MPTSRATAIPTVIQLVLHLQPESLLDVGVGFGKWGHLFREYTDIRLSESTPERYDRKNWKVRIDGIEGYPEYLTPAHDFHYDQIHRGDAAKVLPTLGNYDIIFLGDIIEHFDKKAGMQLLAEAVKKANKAVIISTPKFDTEQGASCGNELERHRSLWHAADFEQFDGAKVVTIDGDLLLAAILKPTISPEVHKRIRRSGVLGIEPRERMRRMVRLPSTIIKRLRGKH
ncbi:MAG: hypothetical protein JWO95_2165 [Verrucomicrobiales bacterium]|nr:hypothetical protein [Verrucomicrobiales bacterium]